jgi:hypothetical protein
MTNFAQEIRNETRAARNLNPSIIELFDRDAERRKLQLANVERCVHDKRDRTVAALEAEIAEAKALAEREIVTTRDTEITVRERIEDQIIDDFHNEIAPHVAAFLETGLGSTKEIVDLVAVTGTRARRELGVDFDARRHVAFAFCVPEIARNPHAINVLGHDAWGIIGFANHTLPSIAGEAIAAFNDERAAEDALRRLVKFIEHHSRHARRDLIDELAAVRFETKRMGIDVESHRRWAELVEERWQRRDRDRREAAAAAANQDAIRRARAGDLSAADGKPTGWFQQMRRLVGDHFGPVLPVQPRPVDSAQSGDTRP